MRPILPAVTRRGARPAAAQNPAGRPSAAAGFGSSTRAAAVGRLERSDSPGAGVGDSASRSYVPAHVRDHGRFPPVLQPPRVSPLARAAVPAGLPGPDRRPEGRALVGVEPPASPQVLGSPGGHPQPDPAAGSGGATSAGSSRPTTRRRIYSRVPDLARYPELRWLNRRELLPTALYAVALSLLFGWTGLVYGYFLSTVLLWHGTFSINSVMHLFGRRAFATTDDSRNSFVFALVTMGEGWHNNHHWAPGSAAQGFRWWEIDSSFYALWLLERLGVVRDLHRRSEPLARRRDGGRPHGPRIHLGASARPRPKAVGALGAGARRRVRHGARGRLRDGAPGRARKGAPLDRRARVGAFPGARAARAAARRGRSRGSARGRAPRGDPQEVERARAQLVQILERLVAMAEELVLSGPQPG